MHDEPVRALAKVRPGPGLELIDRPEPVCGDWEVKIRVLRAGLCGTDLHLQEWDAWAAAQRRPQHVELSAREIEVLRHLCQALSNAEIADRVCVAESTVKTHVSAIMSKLGVTSRLKAVVRAFEWGLVERDD